MSLIREPHSVDLLLVLASEFSFARVISIFLAKFKISYYSSSLLLASDIYSHLPAYVGLLFPL